MIEESQQAYQQSADPVVDTIDTSLHKMKVVNVSTLGLDHR